MLSRYLLKCKKGRMLSVEKIPTSQTGELIMKEYECKATCPISKNHKCCNYCHHKIQCDNICSSFLTDKTCTNTVDGNTVYIVNDKLKNQSP